MFFLLSRKCAIIIFMKSINIEIDKSHMINSIASVQFYESWHVFLRELLQNAYDACNMKQALDWSWGTEFLEIEQAETLNAIREPFDGQIVVSFDSSSRMLSVEDNGIGINASDLEKYVARMGESYYTSDAFKEQRVDYTPMSRHGMGLYSCFMVSRAILIESKKDRAINTAWNVMNIQSLDAIVAKWFEGDGRMEYVTSDRKKPGTKVTLPLKQEYAQQINMDFLVNTIQHFTMYQPIPIKIVCDGQTKVLGHKKLHWNMPFINAIGVTTIRVDTDILEGYLVIYNSRHKQINCKSELFQQNFRITEHVESLELKPKWLREFKFYLNIKNHFLNINMCKTNVIEDEKLMELRNHIGGIIIEHFKDNPYILRQYLTDGTKPMIPSIETERELLSKLVQVSIFMKGREVEVPIKTIIKGFMGKSVRIASIQKSLFTYYKSGYPFDFRKFSVLYDMVIFEMNLNIFKQFMMPYIVSQKYVIGEAPGIIYTEIFADLKEKKTTYEFDGDFDLNPKGCDSPEVFCLVSNERTSPIELIINPYNRNAQLLIRARAFGKVRALETIIVENIKQRIVSMQKRRWDKIIDFGGSIVEEWNSDTALSLQSVWCLESNFADSLNVLVAERLTPREIADYGLAGLYFSDQDFISWWQPPK